MVGGRIGEDGIHGATFSSARRSTSRRPFRRCRSATRSRRSACSTSCSRRATPASTRRSPTTARAACPRRVGEMARGSGGARLDLSRAPLKYAGLAPWEILLSEAQERMTLAVAPEQDRGASRARAAPRGRGHRARRVHVERLAPCHVRGRDRRAPRRWSSCTRATRISTSPRAGSPPRSAEPPATPPADLARVLREPCSGGSNLCSIEEKARHYDHEVKGLTVVKPFVGVRADVPAEATVFLAAARLRAGATCCRKGSIRSYSDIDTHAMAAARGRRGGPPAARGRRAPRPHRAAGQLLLAGSGRVRDRPADGAYKMAQLVRACRGLPRACASRTARR